jgi:hypothetical protein
VRIRRGRIVKLRSVLALAALCGAACVILFVLAPTTRAHQAACGAASDQTVVADRAARIYRVPTPAGNTPLASSYEYLGCTPSHAKPRLLASTGPTASIREIRLRGAIAGFIVDRTGVDTGQMTLKVLDLADGHVLHTVVTNYMVPVSVTSIVTYVLARSGNIAWAIAQSGDLRPHEIVTISRAIGRSVRTLEQGPSIRASSLRLRGHVLDWVDGGHHRHARLP